VFVAECHSSTTSILYWTFLCSSCLPVEVKLQAAAVPHLTIPSLIICYWSGRQVHAPARTRLQLALSSSQYSRVRSSAPAQEFSWRSPSALLGLPNDEKFRFREGSINISLHTPGSPRQTRNEFRNPLSENTAKCKVGGKYLFVTVPLTQRRSLMVVKGNSPVSLCTDYRERACVPECFLRLSDSWSSCARGPSHRNGKLHLISRPLDRPKEASVCIFLL
jgi:hypothetical protein